MVGTVEGLSILRFSKPEINSVFGLKQSGVKCVLHTHVRRGTMQHFALNNI